MTLGTLAICDQPQFDGGRVVGHCARRVLVELDPKEARRELLALGWFLGEHADGIRCPLHNPLRQYDPGAGPRLRDQAPQPAGSRPRPQNGGRVTPLRTPAPDGTV